MRQTSIPIQLQVIFQNIQKVDVFNLEEDQCDLWSWTQKLVH